MKFCKLISNMVNKFEFDISISTTYTRRTKHFDGLIQIISTFIMDLSKFMSVKCHDVLITTMSLTT